MGVWKRTEIKDAFYKNEKDAFMDLFPSQPLNKRELEDIKKSVYMALKGTPNSEELERFFCNYFNNVQAIDSNIGKLVETPEKLKAQMDLYFRESLRATINIIESSMGLLSITFIPEWEGWRKLKKECPTMEVDYSCKWGISTFPGKMFVNFKVTFFKTKTVPDLWLRFEPGRDFKGLDLARNQGKIVISKDIKDMQKARYTLLFSNMETDPINMIDIWKSTREAIIKFSREN